MNITPMEKVDTIESVTPVYKHGTTTATTKVTIKKQGNIAQISVSGVKVGTDGDTFDIPVVPSSLNVSFIIGGGGTYRGYGSIGYKDNVPALILYSNDANASLYGGCTFFCE